MEEKFKLEDYLEYIYSIFIIDNAGILKHVEKIKEEENTDPALISALFTAINTFAEDLGQGELEAIDLGGKKYVFQKETDYFIVLEVDNKIDDDTAKKILENIVERMDLVHKLGLEDGQISLIVDKQKLLDFNILAEIKKHVLDQQKKEELEINSQDLSPIVLPYGKLMKLKRLLENILRAQERIKGIFIAAPWDGDMQITIVDRLDEKVRKQFLEAMLSIISERETSLFEPDELLKMGEKFVIHISNIISAEGGFIAIIVDSPALIGQLKPFILRLVGTIEQLIYS